MILLNVCLGESASGREKIATNGGLLPKCTAELNKARLERFLSSKVAMRDACFIPTAELIKFAR